MDSELRLRPAVADQTEDQELQRQLLLLLCALVLGRRGKVIGMKLPEETRRPYLHEPSQKENRKAAGESD